MQGIECVPIFINAETKEELVKKMQLNNAKLGVQAHYFDIQFANNEWVAWFYYKNNLLKGSNNG